MILNVNSIYTKLLGVFLISGFIYYRFLYERLPRSLLIIYEENSVVMVNYSLIFVAIISICISIAICVINYKVIHKNSIIVKNYLILKYLVKIIVIIKDALFSIYKYLADNIDNSYNMLRKMCIHSYKIFAYKEKYIVIADCTILCIICAGFVYDVLIQFELYYFYKGLLLLGISLLLKLWLYLIYDWVSNIDLTLENLIVTHRFLPDGRDHFHFEVKPGFTAEEARLILSQDREEFLRMVPLKGFLESYYNYEAYYKPRTLFVIYFIYASGWLYILVHGLGLL